MLGKFPKVYWNQRMMAKRSKKEADNSRIKRSLLGELVDRSRVVFGCSMTLDSCTRKEMGTLYARTQPPRTQLACSLVSWACQRCLFQDSKWLNGPTYLCKKISFRYGSNLSWVNWWLLRATRFLIWLRSCQALETILPNKDIGWKVFNFETKTFTLLFFPDSF